MAQALEASDRTAESLAFLQVVAGRRERSLADAHGASKRHLADQVRLTEFGSATS